MVPLYQLKEVQNQHRHICYFEHRLALSFFNIIVQSFNHGTVTRFGSFHHALWTVVKLTLPWLFGFDRKEYVKGCQNKLSLKLKDQRELMHYAMCLFSWRMIVLHNAEISLGSGYVLTYVK